jgi:predicted TIM-barrel fold metal-dependent hydrolase
MEYRVISTDSHVNEPPNCFVDRFPARLRDSAPKIVETADGGEGWTCEGRKPIGFGLGSLAGKRFEDYKFSGMRFSDLLPGNYDPVEHLKDQDRDGVDASVIYPGYAMGLPTIQDRELRLAAFRAYNDWLAEEFVASDPRRIIGLAMLPVDDGIEQAVAEFNRSLDKGHRGGILPTYPDKSYADPIYDPLWAAAQERSAPLHFHRAIGRNVPAGMSLSQHPGTFVASIVLRFFAAIEPVSHILFSGVLERFPSLKLVSAESDSGWLAFFMQACDDQWERQRHWAKLPLTRPPSEIIREQVLVTFMDDAVGCSNVRFTGADNLMWASDYPHSVTTWPNSRQYIEKQMKGVQPEAQAKLLAGNAVKLYGLS